MSTYRCRESFQTWVNGEPRTVPAGRLVDSTDAVLKGREHLFDKAEDFVEKWGRSNRMEVKSPVEQATAEPGERRSVGRPRVTRSEEKPAEKPVLKAEDKKKDGEV